MAKNTRRVGVCENKTTKGNDMGKFTIACWLTVTLECSFLNYFLTIPSKRAKKLGDTHREPRNIPLPSFLPSQDDQMR